MHLKREKRMAYGLWCAISDKTVLERYAALRCLWHGVRVVGRSNRLVALRYSLFLKGLGSTRRRS
eukprot:907099-Prymnesium_polylepis.1